LRLRRGLGRCLVGVSESGTIAAIAAIAATAARRKEGFYAAEGNTKYKSATYKIASTDSSFG